MRRIALVVMSTALVGIGVGGSSAELLHRIKGYSKHGGKCVAVLLLVFIVFHILHFTTGTVFPIASRPDAQYPAFSHTDVYGNVVSAFRNPWVTAFYVVAMLFLMLHLFHGAWSSVRTLGLSKPSRDPLHR